MSLDFLVRKAAARWCYDVSLEDVGLAGHAARVAVAGRILTSISPATPVQDDALTHIVFLVRTFAPSGEDAEPVEVEATLDAVLVTFVKLGVWTT